MTNWIPCCPIRSKKLQNNPFMVLFFNKADGCCPDRANGISAHRPAGNRLPEGICDSVLSGTDDRIT